ncbi:MAG: PAS domain S-box protein, partial [Anaerolineales bacterium]
MQTHRLVPVTGWRQSLGGYRMGTPLRVLLVGDSAKDATLVSQELERDGFEPIVKRVRTRRSFSSALGRDSWDLIVADASAQRLAVPEALAVLHGRTLDVPLIAICEKADEVAAAAIEAGAQDVILRENLPRIGLAIRRALHQASERRALRQAQAALAESLRQKEMVLDSIQGLVVQVDPELRIVWANRIACEVLGLPREEVIGRHCYELWKQYDKPCEGCPVRDALSTGEPQPDKLDWVGDTAWLVRAYPLRDKDGAVVGAVEIRVETTEKEQAEEAYRAVVEHSLQGIIVLGEEGVVFCNPAAAEMLDHSVEEAGNLSPDGWRALLHPDDLDGVQDRLRSILARELVPPRHEFRVIVGGAERWLEMHASPVIHRGDPAVQAALIDITDRKHAEKALRESEDMYRMLIRTSPDGVTATDLDGRITFASRRAAEMHGFARPEELVGIDGLELLPAEEREAAVERMRSTAAGNAVAAREYRLRRRDGTTFYGEVKTSLIRDADGNPSAFITTTRDITERKEAQEAVRLRVDQLSALARASQAVTASLELDQVLAEIVSLAGDVSASQYTGVVLVDDNGTVGKSAENFPGRPALQYRIRERGLTSWIVETHRPAIIDEIADDGTMTPDPGNRAPRFANPPIVEAGIRSLAGLPLAVKGRLLGVLYLHSPQPSAFHGQLAILNAFANQAAIAIENARLFQAEERQMQRLSLLADVARIVATTLRAEELLQAVADSIHTHLAIPIVALLTLDEEQQTLVLRGSSGEAVASQKAIAVGTYRQPVARGIAGRVARTARPHLTPDVSLDPYYFSAVDIPIQSALWVPIRDEGRVAGVVGVESHDLARFDEEDQSLMEAVADTVAIGLRNARLYDET